jgi:hypothetical protein
MLLLSLLLPHPQPALPQLLLHLQLPLPLLLLPRPLLLLPPLRLPQQS